ncbi:hypothetical protein PI124_g22197 [Phytophthora idaei]|nr:hypothetical protein PI125_g23932 [Phytophthora idaei]KAG3127207.1 hypothetical protein PI126_g21962 [Phytophthora idaei]KAG3232726.1 hypothetical protein PI124_g22197 [Phytophthora idaei]
MNTANEGSQGSRGGKRASRGGAERRRTTKEDLSSEDDDLFVVDFEDEDPQAELTRQMEDIAVLNDADPTPRIGIASRRGLDRIKLFSGFRNKSENSMQWPRIFVYEMTGTHT